MRLLYSLLLYGLTPLIFLRLIYRGRRNPGYRLRWGERLGEVRRPSPERPIWVHAVSVGEAQAALPLVKALRERYPQTPVLVTTTTPTGSERVRAALGESVWHVYAPYDLPHAVRRFLDRMQPRIALVMETELWPNLYAQLKSRRIPLLLVNARLSPRSAEGYRRVRPLTAPTLACIDLICAQSQADAERFLALGAPPARVLVTGNIKFDLSVAEDLPARGKALRETLGRKRPVWIAASTHEGEEAQVLSAFDKVRRHHPDTLLVLVPRHPERFKRVAALCREWRLRIARRSRGETCSGECAVYLGDTMGELMLLYAAADLAYVGGSLVPTGGHNLLEPAALGLPLLTGPHVFNFREITDRLVAAEAVRVVKSPDELAAAVVTLISRPETRREVGARAQAVVAANRGALGRCLQLIGERLDQE